MSEEPKELTEESAPARDSFSNELYAWLQALVFALLALVLVFTFLGRLIGVEGPSMYPTLHDKDMVLLKSLAYHPKQGDIVVLNKEFATIQTPIVKRVIATGGQTVAIDYETGTVSVDGQILDEPYINEPMVDPQYSFMTNNYVEVPEGSLFVMGDNRNHSSDSRDTRLGVVDERYVLGQAVVTIFPFQNIGFLS